MKKALRLILISVITLALSANILGTNVYSRPQGIKGYSDSGCTPCHGADPGANTEVTITGLPGAYEPDKNYSLTVEVTSTVPSTWGGFDLSVTNGVLVVTDPVNTQLDSGELIHTDSGKQQRSWPLNWTAPTSGDATFYVAGLAANASGDADGDEWALYTVTLSIIPEFPNLILLLVFAGTITVVLLFTKKFFQDSTNKSHLAADPT